jgi:hypothetical protein
LQGRASSIEGESTEGGEEFYSSEEERMEEFLGWPPELLLTPQHKHGLHQRKRKQMEGESSARAQKGQECGEGRRHDCDTEAAAVESVIGRRRVGTGAQ